MNEIELLQRKIKKSGFITNEEFDKSARFQISKTLKTLIANNDINIVIAAVDMFVTEFMDRTSNERIINKGIYFQKAIQANIQTVSVPDIEFGRSTLTPESKRRDEEDEELIIRDIAYSIIVFSLVIGPEVLSKKHRNPLDNNFPGINFEDVPRGLEEQGMKFLRKHKTDLNPLIKKYINSDHPDERNEILELLEYYVIRGRKLW